MMQPTQGTFLGITPVSSVSNGLYFLTLLLVSVTRVALSIHQKECRKSLGCVLYIRCALSIEKCGNFCRYPLPILLVTLHFFCLWCDSSRWLLWCCFPWQWFTECSIRACITLSDLSYISWQTYTWESI